MNDFTFDALANEHRRTLLVELLESSPPDDTVPVPTGEDSRASEPARLQVELYHTHLPKLRDYGYIRWNRSTHEISRGPRFEEVRPLLEFVDDRADEVVGELR